MNILRSIVQENTDWYLDEIVCEMEVRSGKHVSVSTLWSAYMARIGTYQREQLIFLDESAKDERTITRGYGYSEINTRAIKKVAFIRVDIIEGSCTKEKFKEFVINQVLPQMNSYPYSRSVLVLDNAKIHHHSGLLEYLNAFGVRVEFLPPCSPDLNPIEMAFSFIKHYLRRHRYFVENSSDPNYPLLIACSQITLSL
ncbi:5526_t:CDS:2 [Gigaspora margarita]|uniref:5526_t:CDS:1 n=1 Tax=Gigaspora margarita TaxID=4874 RepID=A0ABN7W4Q9_GIGMA|nr:5526_t:CDS:2 [Gigaspora margarita]